MTNNDLPEGVILKKKVISKEESHTLQKIILNDIPDLIQKVKIKEPELPLPIERVPVFSYGLWWSPINHRYEKTRKDIPKELLDIGNKTFKSTWNNSHLPRIDSVVINVFENINHSLVMHYDNLEDPKVIQSGSPVLSISLGSTCTYQLGPIETENDNYYKEIVVEDKDAILLGGESRLRKHGVFNLQENTGSTLLYGKRISLTFRQVTS
jgi:alkylated DNA repair protein (DNA oxidative demethylase)